MGVASSGHSFSVNNSSNSACGTSIQSSACSLCTEDSSAQRVCKDEEEVLVEPCSVLEELGFFHGKKTCRSPARTGGLCQIVPFVMPPSPARARCCPHVGDSPTVVAPRYGSPQPVNCPPPRRITESPPKPSYMNFEYDSPSPLPILPAPVQDDIDFPSPVAAASIRRSAPVRKFIARESDGFERSTLVDIDEDVQHCDTNGQEGPQTPIGRQNDTPASSGHASIATVFDPSQSPNVLELAQSPARPIRPWSSCVVRSPYRGGVLSLFTPSPPSPPRRRPVVSPVLPDGKEAKDLGEADQIAIAIAASLQEAGGELEDPSQLTSPPPPILPTETADPPPEKKAPSDINPQVTTGTTQQTESKSQGKTSKATPRRYLARWCKGSKKSL